MSEISWSACHLGETEFFAECLANAIEYHLESEEIIIIRLDGPLGAGKTTLTSCLCRNLGVAPELVSSPTFSLQNIYPAVVNGKPSTVTHYDFYRIKDEDELAELGFEETISAPGIYLVEWSSRFPEWFPDDCLQLEIQTVSQDERLLNIRFDKENTLSTLKRLLLSSHHPPRQ